jgi:hypothetical protein
MSLNTLGAAVQEEVHHMRDKAVDNTLHVQIVLTYLLTYSMLQSPS